jgi:hypothetical protein
MVCTIFLLSFVGTNGRISAFLGMVWPQVSYTSLERVWFVLSATLSITAFDMGRSTTPVAVDTAMDTSVKIVMLHVSNGSYPPILPTTLSSGLCA